MYEKKDMLTCLGQDVSYIVRKKFFSDFWSTRECQHQHLFAGLIQGNIEQALIDYRNQVQKDFSEIFTSNAFETKKERIPYKNDDSWQLLDCISVFQ